MHAQKAIDEMSARWRLAGLPDFVWWIPLVFFSSNLVAILMAVAQRVGEAPMLPVIGLGTLATLPCVVDAATLRRAHWASYLLLTFGATATLAVAFPVAYDFAPAVWVITAGHLAATERFRSAAAGGGLMLVGIVVTGRYGLDAWPLWLCLTALGWDTGFILQYQQRELDRVQHELEARELRAVLEERQRIAREVHDVVAHSLSVTMLHLTAARRDLEQEGAAGIDEALDALRDAETQGRQAMTDIRHAVGLLGTTTGEVRATPDAVAVPALVAQFREAGLDVELHLDGDPASVPAANSLTLYRVVQESLANVAKHQPRARTVVALDLSSDRQAVQVWNSLPTSGVERRSGSGLTGMRQRAELVGGSFHAGPAEDGWLVEVRIPADGGLQCPLTGLARRFRAGTVADPSEEASPA